MKKYPLKYFTAPLSETEEDFEGLIVAAGSLDEAVEEALTYESRYGEIDRDSIRLTSNRELINSDAVEYRGKNEYKDIHSHNFSFGKMMDCWHFTILESDHHSRSEKEKM